MHRERALPRFDHMHIIVIVKAIAPYHRQGVPYDVPHVGVKSQRTHDLHETRQAHPPIHVVHARLRARLDIQLDCVSHEVSAQHADEVVHARMLAKHGTQRVHLVRLVAHVKRQCARRCAAQLLVRVFVATSQQLVHVKRPAIIYSEAGVVEIAECAKPPGAYADLVTFK